MTDLVSFLNKLAEGTLARAPKTGRAVHFGSDGAPYKPVMLLVIFFRVLERHPKFLQSKLYFDDLEATFLKVYTELFPSSSHKVGESQAVQAFWKLGAGSPKLVLFNSPFGAELELESEMKKSAGHQVKSKPKLARLVEFAHFGLGDWELVQNPINTEAIVSFLLASHFSDIDTHSRLRSRIERALS